MSGAPDRAEPGLSAGEPDIAANARHRTANLFQLLTTLTRMRIQRTRDTEARRQLTWLLDSMGALGVLQRQLWAPGGEDFAQFLAEMSPVWHRRCAGRPIDLEVAAAPVAAPEQLASALSLIANELVINAIDHAFGDGRAGRVQIRLETVDSARACLIVTDNGRGYDPASLGGQTLGLWLVEGLTAQLRGTLTTTTTEGVTARVEFPCAAFD